MSSNNYSRLASASPKVRKFARELGVDINKVSGSERQGRVTESDIKLFKTFLKLKKRKNYYFINREKTRIKFFKSKNKNYNKQYLENSGLNILAFFVKNIYKVFQKLKKLKLNTTDIFEVNLIKKNKIFFAKFLF